MVSCIWLCVFSVVILPHLSAKSVSLNKLIEAEEALPSENTPTVSRPHFITKPVSLNKLIEAEEKNQQIQKVIHPKATPERTRKLRTGLLRSGLNKITKSGTIFSQNKNLSPLHYRKTFEIKSPIKPKRVTLFQRTNRIRNQSGKRETYQYGAINQKYIPLLRNIGLLFDNVLGGDSSEAYGEDYSNESEERVCTCVSKKTGRESRQEAAGSARVGVTETAPLTQAATTTTPHPAHDNLGSVGRHQNISLLFTRNTTGVWRNNFGVDERSGPAHLGSSERHIPGDSRDDERDPRDGEVEADPEDNEEDTDRPAGDTAGDDGFSRGNGNPRGFIGKSIVSHKFKTSPNKTSEGTGGHVPEYEGEIQFEIRTDKAKGSRVLPQPDSGLRDTGKEVQAAEESDVIEYGDTPHQQLTVRNGEDTEENQKLRGAYEGVTNLEADTSENNKYVMIYDGYSVARDVNGKNTLTEKAITIHS